MRLNEIKLQKQAILNQLRRNPKERHWAEYELSSPATTKRESYALRVFIPEFVYYLYLYCKTLYRYKVSLALKYQSELWEYIKNFEEGKKNTYIDSKIYILVWRILSEPISQPTDDNIA